MTEIVLIFGEKWELNSAGLECYPYKVKVIGSNPIIPTNTVLLRVREQAGRAVNGLTVSM